MKGAVFRLIAILVVGVGLVSMPEASHCYTANQVFFEFLPSGKYRVTVSYTVPALKERREAKVIFTRKKEAEKFYWDLVRGADFSLGDHKRRQFVNPPLKPKPW